MKKPRPTPLMEKFFTGIEYFEEVVESESKTEGNAEAASQAAPQIKFYWSAQCTLPHSGSDTSGVITDKMGTSSNFSRHMKRFHCSELEKWQTPAKLKSAVQSGPGQLSIVQSFNVKPKKYDKDHPRQKLYITIHCDESSHRMWLATLRCRKFKIPQVHEGHRCSLGPYLSKIDFRCQTARTCKQTEKKDNSYGGCC
jgi:hypothetical protein